jgi:hypothetical protein
MMLSSEKRASQRIQIEVPVYIGQLSLKLFYWNLVMLAGKPGQTGLP